jgi:hypothetical protein
LKDAIITRHSVISFVTRQRLRLLLEKYVQPSEKLPAK